MRVLYLLLTGNRAIDPAQFLMIDAGIDRTFEPEEPFSVSPLTGVDDPDLAVIELATEIITTDERRGEADIALASALLADMVQETTQTPKLKALPSDPLLKELVEYALENQQNETTTTSSTTTSTEYLDVEVAEGSGEATTTQELQTESQDQTTVQLTTTTADTTTTTGSVETTTESQTTAEQSTVTTAETFPSTSPVTEVDFETTTTTSGTTSTTSSTSTSTSEPTSTSTTTTSTETNTTTSISTSTLSVDADFQYSRSTTSSTTSTDAIEESTVTQSDLESSTAEALVGSGDFQIEFEQVEEATTTTTVVTTTSTTTSTTTETTESVGEKPIADLYSFDQEVEIVCGATSMCVTMSPAFLNELWPDARPEDLHFDEMCDDYTVRANKNRIELCIEPQRERNFLTCGTRLSGNSTHVIFNNNVTAGNHVQLNTQHLRTKGSENSIVLGWRCVYPLQLVVDNEDMLYKRQNNDLSQRSGLERVRHIIRSGSGNFQVKFQLFKDSSFTDKIRSGTPLFSTDDHLHVRLRLYEPFPHAKLQVQNCWATPSPNPQHPDGFFLIDEYCATDLGREVNVTVLENGASAAARFESKVFIFSRSTSVYLHCRVNVCLQTNTNQCNLIGQRRCQTTGSGNNQELKNNSEKERDRRSAEEQAGSEHKQIVTYGPIDVNTGSFLLEDTRPEVYNPDIGDFDSSFSRGDEPQQDQHDIFVSTLLIVMIVGISAVAVILAVSLWRRPHEEKGLIQC